MTRPAYAVSAGREQRVEQALFRGASLTLANPAYRRRVSALLHALLEEDLGSGDLTARALEIGGKKAFAEVIAREDGVLAGLEECGLLLREHGIAADFVRRDGEMVRPGEAVLRAEGERGALLALERTGLNLLQRMSGIATASRRLQERVGASGAGARITGTRKTLWGLLDKRALHLGSGGTHRLGLSEAILIKNNHLALLAGSEEEAAPLAVEKAWRLRGEAAFIEVEVRGAEAARAAAGAFRRMQEADSGGCPCLILLDNMTPEQTRESIALLRREGLWDAALLEASGGISESNAQAYADAGVDAISVGALTHSARALDLCQRIS